jgi:hypothetical protein
MGMVNGVCCEKGCWGGGEEGVLAEGSRSISIELRPLMADNADNRLRCSGGRLSGWVSRSVLLRREEENDGSVACLTKLRDALDLESLEPGEGAAAGWEDFLGDFVGDLVGDFVGEDGSE